MNRFVQRTLTDSERIYVMRLVLCICNEFELDESELLGRCRRTDIAMAKHILCGILAERGFGPTDQRRIIGDIDRTSVIHRRDTHRDYMRLYPWYRKLADSIYRRMGT